MKGWVKLHRKILEWEWYNDTNTFRVFFHCLISASYKPNTWRGIPLERGQFVTTPAKLGEKIGLSRQQSRRSLDKLQTTREITIKPTNKYSIVTVCNYASYNPSNDGDEPSNDTLVEQESDQQTEHKRTTEKEDKKIRSKEIKNSSTPRPAIAWTAEGGWSGIEEKDFDDWAEAYPACDVPRQLAAMTQWLLSNPSKAKKKQWRRFATNWLSRSQERGGDGESNSAKGSAGGGMNSSQPHSAKETETTKVISDR